MSKQVMEQWLEALKTARHQYEVMDMRTDEFDEAIASLKEAIKQQGEPVAWKWRRNYSNGGYSEDVFLFEAQAKAMLEPEAGFDESVIPLYPSAPTIPKGWKLVPNEPTPKMYANASHLVTGTSGNKFEYQNELYEAYKAMLAAAPEYKGTNNDKSK